MSRSWPANGCSSARRTTTASRPTTREPARKLWTYFADGPVRFAPLAWQDKLYFASDDGYLYCLAGRRWLARLAVSRRTVGPQDSGQRAADFDVAGPRERRSSRTARSTSPPASGRSWASSCTPSTPRRARCVWTNDGDGSIYIKQPHNADSFAGVAPQGPLVAIGDKLLVPGGRSVPACYDRATGKLLYYQLAENGKTRRRLGRRGRRSIALQRRRGVRSGQRKAISAPIGELVTFADGRLYDYRNRRSPRARPEVVRASKLEDTIDRKGEAESTSKWSIKRARQDRKRPR